MNSSPDIEPRVPMLKLSMKRTVLASKGTVVPPEVIRTNLVLFYNNKLELFEIRGEVDNLRLARLLLNGTV